MEHAYKTIADLFSVDLNADTTIIEPERKKQGRTAEESDELGRQSLVEGNFRSAIQHFKTAVAQRDPNDVRSMIDLAGAYDYGDESPIALRLYEKALRIKNDLVEPHLGLSDVYRRYGRFKDSIQKMAEAVRLEPNNAYLHIKLAEALRDAGEPKKALESAQHAVFAQPDGAFYHYWTGDLLINLKRYDEALESLRAAIELSPGDDFLYLRAAVAFWGANRRAEAIKAIRLASDLDPSKNFYHGLLERLLAEMGQVEESALEAGRAGKMDRYDHETVTRLLKEMEVLPSTPPALPQSASWQGA